MPDMRPQTLNLDSADAIALQYLGAAVVLQWPNLPERARQLLLQQADSVGGLPPVTSLHAQIEALIERRTGALLSEARELYRSPNGDRWSLVRDETGRLLVQHEPNLASGGQRSLTEVGAFLSTGSNGPERQALVRELATLTEDRRGQ